jgi:2-polyprenyl-3-methyl-5-hydroxy-6-metoxy-1,4-benzoquinol methylase
MDNNTQQREIHLNDTGERIIPTKEGEVSVVFSRHQFAYRFALKFASGKDILDVGCGTGYGCSILAERANYVLGLDKDKNAIEYCNAHYSAPNINFRQTDASMLEREREFDVAVSFQVIEHMRNVDDFIDRIKNLVKQNGIIIITTPNVKISQNAETDNPFHLSDMNYEQFERLIDRKFKTYKIFGVAHASQNILRSIIGKFPFYREIGLLLKRNNPLKKVAVQAMNMTKFRVVEDNVAKEAIDLLAVCTNDIERGAGICRST